MYSKLIVTVMYDALRSTSETTP